MLVVISPAKRLDWTPRDVALSTPDLLDDARILAGHARQLSLTKLKALMGLSDDLARLNRDRFARMETDPDAADVRPAAWAFAGDTYQGLDMPSLDADAVTYAENHLRILSGLYGLLRPADAIEAYRLEMGSRLKSRRGETLYDFWGAKIADELTQLAKTTQSDVLVNCASQEYFGAVDKDALGLRVLTPQFLEIKSGTPKTVSFFAKRARGAMARYIVENRITDPDDLRGFDIGGYAFDAALSKPDAPAFARQAVSPKAA